MENFFKIAVLIFSILIFILSCLVYLTIYPDLDTGEKILSHHKYFSLALIYIITILPVVIHFIFSSEGIFKSEYEIDGDFLLSFRDKVTKEKAEKLEGIANKKFSKKELDKYLCKFSIAGNEYKLFWEYMGKAAGRKMVKDKEQFVWSAIIGVTVIVFFICNLIYFVSLTNIPEGRFFEGDGKYLLIGKTVNGRHILNDRKDYAYEDENGHRVIRELTEKEIEIYKKAEFQLFMCFWVILAFCSLMLSVSAMKKRRKPGMVQ